MIEEKFLRNPLRPLRFLCILCDTHASNFLYRKGRNGYAKNAKGFLIFAVSLFLVLFFSCASSKKNNSATATLSSEDQKIFDEVQRQTFQYFWDGAEPNSGLARE